MNNNDRTNEHPQHRQFQGQDSYHTGNTRPPRKHRGLITFLLVLVIFMGGVATILGLTNIRLFHRLANNPNSSLSFSQNSGKPHSEDLPSNQPDETPKPDTDITLDLQDSPISAENIPQDGGLSLQAIYEKAIPSVVSISCQTPSGASTGTGVVISQQGYLLTNAHVVADAQMIRILFSDGQEQVASIVGTDTVSDLAVLHVHTQDLVPAEFGDSGSLRVGDLVVAIGDPLGAELRGTMTDGIVSAINRDIVTQGRTMTLIQTNAALNSGNSGGPLLNCYGQVVGINTMKIGDYMSDAGVEGLGFAIPSVTVEEIVNQLLSQGYVSGRPELGFRCEAVSSFLQLYYQLPQGVYITEVTEGSAVAQKGIAPGDILLSFDGVRIADTETLYSTLYAHDAGDTINIIIYRAGRQYSLDLTLDEAR